LIPDEERHYSNVAAKHLRIPISYVAADRYSLFDEQVPGDMNQPEPFLLSPLTAQFHNLLRLCAAHSRVALTGYDGDAFMNESNRRWGQYRNAVASGQRLVSRLMRMFDPTLSRGGTDPIQVRIPEWINESFAKRVSLHDRLKQSCKNPVNPVQKRPRAMRALDSKVWSPLFEGYDPAATKLNLEVRHPFIDVRLVEYLLSIPAAPWCVNKHILRVTMRDRLPAAILNRPKTPLAGDPALQIARSTSVRWLDSFEVNPQLECFVNLKQRRSIADELTPDGLWASLRVFALNYWLTRLPANRSTSDGKSGQTKSSVPDLNRLDCLINGDTAWNVNRNPTDRATSRNPASHITSRK
jgi:asparagine synthase (glutamine-hydrolysing)